MVGFRGSSNFKKITIDKKMVFTNFIFSLISFLNYKYFTLELREF